jgi:hypothetical protein
VSNLKRFERRIGGEYCPSLSHNRFIRDPRRSWRETVNA